MARREAGEILTASALQCKPFDVHHLCHEAGAGQNRCARFDLFPETGGQQHLDPGRVLGRRSLDLKVDGHLIQRVRNVLVGLHLDAPSHFFVAEPRLQLDHARND